jgi:mannose-6-phosphate isomerase-like protein (cupin superfamily)
VAWLETLLAWLWGGWRRKAWGWTRTLYRDANSELVECLIVRGGHSSVHYHRGKHNFFFVRSGTLRLDEWEDGEAIAGDETSHYLWPSKFGFVAAGTPHRFHAADDVHLFEFYSAVDDGWIEADDIVRLTKNGVGR